MKSTVTGSVEGGVITVERIDMNDTLRGATMKAHYRHEVLVLNTIDAKVRAGLIALGWTPPEEMPTIACPYCGVQVPEDPPPERPPDYCHH